MKSVGIRSMSGPYFPAFGLNAALSPNFPYSVGMRQNTDQRNFEYGYFSRSACVYVYVLVHTFVRIKHLCLIVYLLDFQAATSRFGFAIWVVL